PSLSIRVSNSLLFKCFLLVLLFNRASFLSIYLLFYPTFPGKILELPTVLFSIPIPYPTMLTRFHVDFEITTVSKLTSTVFHRTLDIPVDYFFYHLCLILRSNLIEKITIIIGTAK